MKIEQKRSPGLKPGDFLPKDMTVEAFNQVITNWVYAYALYVNDFDHEKAVESVNKFHSSIKPYKNGESNKVGSLESSKDQGTLTQHI